MAVELSSAAMHPVRQSSEVDVMEGETMTDKPQMTGGWNPEPTTLTLTIAWDEGNECWLWIVNQGRRCEGCNHVLSRSAAFEAAVACAKEVLNQ